MTLSVWCDSVDQAAKGKTAGTYDEIGTVTVKTGAKEVLGIIALVANSGPTSGENGIPILRVDSKDLNVSKEDFVLSGAITDGIATNDKEAPVLAEFIPFKVDPAKSLDGAEVTFSLTSNVAVTEGWDVVVGLVYADGKPDQQFFMEMLAGACAPAMGGDVAESDAGIKAATSTAFTDTIKISSIGKELIGLCGFVNPNAPTAKEAVAGIVQFTAPAMKDFAPQNWPFIVGWSASLGTPVGTQANVSQRNGMYWPTRFPLPEKNFSMSVAMLLATAITNEADGVAAAKWR